MIHYLRRLSPFGRRHDLTLFRESYVPEGLPPATTSTRARAHHPGRCTVCGACDAVCPLLDATTTVHTEFSGPLAFVVSGARADPMLDDIEQDLVVLTGAGCAACRRCESACPEDIPILALAQDRRAQLDVVRAARTA